MNKKIPNRAFRELDVNSIQSNEMDLREDVRDEQLNGLGSTIEDFGVLSPVLVSLDSHTMQYKLILGGRRLQSARHAGLQKIPSFIVDDVSERNGLIMMLIENMQRKDLEPLEEARGMAELRDRFKFPLGKIAQVVGKRVQFVKERLALLELPQNLRQQVAQRRLGVSQATSLTKLAGKEAKQIALAEKIIEQNLSGEVVERIIEEETRPRRSHRKMTRKHKLKKRGEMLSEGHINSKLQQAILRGEQLLDFLDGIPLKRWSAEGAEKLDKTIEAVEKGLTQLRKRIKQRLKDTL